MAYEKKPVIRTWEINSSEPSFELVLNAACERLHEMQVQYSIRRIKEMEDELGRIEKELDEFLGGSVIHEKTE